jgi:hypothetical protein
MCGGSYLHKWYSQNDTRVRVQKLVLLDLG